MRLLRIASLALVACAAFVYAGARSSASDHQDTLYLAQQRPGADITDVYVFPAANPRNVVLAMDVHPLIVPSLATSTAFDPGVLYQLKVADAPSFRESHVIQFKAEGTGDAQRIGVYAGAPDTPGTTATMTERLGSVALNRAAMVSGGVRVYAGAREEPFAFDLTQFFKIDPDRNYKNQPRPPAPSARCFRTPGRDFFRGYDVLSLIVEMPRTMLANGSGTLGVVRVWATTSVEQGGTWTQVERLGRPAVKEAFEPFRLHDVTNRAAPWGGDTALARSIHDYMMRPLPAGAGRSAAVASAMVKVLIPDEIQANLAAQGHADYLAVETNGKSGLPVGAVRAVPAGGIEGLKKAIGDNARKFGGRDPYSPVIDLSLGAIYGSLIPKLGLAPDDGKEMPCLTSDHVGTPVRHVTTSFPYIGAPVR